MKKLLLILVMMVMAPSIMKADEIVVGTATDSINTNPFLSYIHHSWAEIIYQADEIGQACTIESIAFNCVDGLPYAINELNIYFAETTKTEFANKSEWTPEEELTLVYSGENVVIGDDAWETFKLDTVFEYSGEKNLAVVISKSSTSFVEVLKLACYNSSNSIMFTASDTDASFAKYPTADGMSVYSKKPVMKLITPATKLDAPTNLRAYIRQDVPDYNYKYEITMAWDAVEGAQGYDVFVNTTKEQDFYLGYTGGTAYVAGSNEETTFEFYIVAFNDELGIESEPSEICTVTVVDDAIEEMNASFNIYPNPVNDKLYIETLTQTQTVEIYDVYGRQQSMVNGQQSTVIDVTNLNSGVYFVKVVTENGESVKRFIKK